MEQKKKIEFGKLGKVEIVEFQVEPLDVYAKYVTTGPTLACPDGTIVGTGGASPYNDDTTCPTGPMYTL